MSEEQTTAAELLAAVVGIRRPTRRLQRTLAAIAALPRMTRQSLGPHGLATRFSLPLRWAVAICAVDELADRHSNELPAVRSARDALLLLSDLHRSRVETAAVVLLDGGWRRMGIRIVAMGSVDRVDITPADIFGPALRIGASAVILAHSHVCAEAGPTADDRRITERLRRAADLLRVLLLDHLIVAAGSAYSFAEAEQWPSLLHGYRGSVTARRAGYHGGMAACRGTQASGSALRNFPAHPCRLDRRARSGLQSHRCSV